MICEICGGKAPRLRKVVVEGSIVSVCLDCFNTLTKKIPVEKEFTESISRTQPRVRKTVAKPVASKTVEKKTSKSEGSLRMESMELVDNYRELIRNRMKALGWNEEELGAKTGLKTSLIRKIQAGRITPSIPDVRKIEDALKIKLLKPGSMLQEHVPVKNMAKPLSNITLGDVLREDSLDRE
ncbi:MAG: multiprotein-bridging factor 1 family protein [Thermoproteota archaeon]